MSAFGHVVNTIILVAVLLMVPGGCREKAPTPSQNHDLSLTDIPLLPTGSPTKVASLADAQQNRADWVAFRNPEEVAAAPTSVKPKQAEVNTGELAADIKAELEEVVTDYNDVATDGDIEGLLEYFVEQQQEVTEGYLTSAKSLGEAVGNLRDALPKDAPEETAPIIAILDQLAAASSLTLSLTEIEKGDGQRIVGRVSTPDGTQPTMNDLEFVLVEDEWFFQLGQPDMVESWTTQATKTTEALTPLITEAQGGGDSAALLAKVAEAGKGLLAASDPTDNTEDGDAEDDETEEDEDETDDSELDDE